MDFRKLLEEEMNFSLYNELYNKLLNLLKEASENMSFDEFLIFSADAKQAVDNTKGVYFQYIGKKK